MTSFHIRIIIDWDTVKDEDLKTLKSKLNNHENGDYMFSAYKDDLL